MNKLLRRPQYLRAPKNLDQYFKERHKNDLEWRILTWSIGLLIIASSLFLGIAAWAASPIEKLAGVEGDAVRDDAYYCERLHLYQINEEDREAITSYCSSL